MKNEVSVFVLDISDPSRLALGAEINTYFDEIKINISLWTQYVIPAKVVYLTNRELIVVSSTYASSYLLAFYIQLIWKYKEHLPYFGLSFGNMEEDILNINLETWQHPLIREARNAKDFLINNSSSNPFHFNLSHLPDQDGIHQYKKEIESFLNSHLDLMQELRNGQTAIQSLVCSLYFTFGQQNKVSDYLGRTKSTISSHMKNGKTNVIFHAFQQIITFLYSVQQNKDNQQITALEKNIKQNIAQHIEVHFPKDR